MASSNLTQALLLGGMGGGGMMSPMGLGMYDPAALGAMQRLGLGQGMVQEGMSSAPAYPAQALSRLGQSLIGALMMRHGFSDLQDINKQQAAEIPALDAYIHPPTAPAAAPMPAAATPSPTAGTPSAPPQPSTTSYSASLPTAANNPLNIRFAGQPGAANTNGFAAFPTADAGKAATDSQFGLYADRGVNTLRGLISTWAPPSENNTDAYIARVAKQTGLDPDAPINLRDPGVAAPIQQAMAGVEGNKNATLDTSGMAANSANSGQPTPTPGGIQTGMQNPQVQSLWETIKRITQQQSALSPYDIRGQRYLQGQLELTKQQLGIGNWQPNPTNPNEMVNVNTGERKLLLTAAPRFATGAHNQTLVGNPGGGVSVYDPNVSGFKAGSPEQALAELGGKVQAGTATPQEIASYNTAAALFQKREVTMNPSTQQPISVPTQPLPVGAPQPGGPPGSNASPPGGKPQQESSTGVIPLTPGGAPTPAVTERYANLDKLHQSYNAAQDDLQQAALLKDQLHQIGTSGPATEVLSKLSQYAAQAGVSPETLTQFSLPSGASEATASALANGLAMELAKMRFPGQRISNMDLKTAQSTKPNPNQPLASADFLIDNTIVPQAQRDIDRYGSVVHLTDPQHPDFDPSLGSLNARLYDFDQANPVSKYTPRLQQQQSPQVAAPNAAAPPATAPGASQADIEAEMRRRGLLK